MTERVETSSEEHYFFWLRHGAHPGVTVTKQDWLPPGDFKITEYCWGEDVLSFLDADRFTDDERQDAYKAWKVIINTRATT
jgi:hypothetical protein